VAQQVATELQMEEVHLAVLEEHKMFLDLMAAMV
jgi:hypothetical protein